MHEGTCGTIILYCHFTFQTLNSIKGQIKNMSQGYTHIFLSAFLFFLWKKQSKHASVSGREKKKRAHYFPSLSLLSRQINPSVVLNFEIVAQALFNSHSLSLSLSVICVGTQQIFSFSFFFYCTLLYSKAILNSGRTISLLSALSFLVFLASQFSQQTKTNKTNITLIT